MTGVPTLAGYDEATRRELVYWRARGLSQEAAAAKAGVPLSPRLSRYFRSKPFREDMQEAIRERLELDLAPKALARIEGILDDKNASPKVVIDAAKATLDRSGHSVALTKLPDALADRRPEDMTPAELAELIERLEREKMGRAVPVRACLTTLRVSMLDERRATGGGSLRC